MINTSLREVSLLQPRKRRLSSSAGRFGRFQILPTPQNSRLHWASLVLPRETKWVSHNQSKALPEMHRDSDSDSDSASHHSENEPTDQSYTNPRRGLCLYLTSWSVFATFLKTWIDLLRRAQFICWSRQGEPANCNFRHPVHAEKLTFKPFKPSWSISLSSAVGVGCPQFSVQLTPWPTRQTSCSNIPSFIEATLDEPDYLCESECSD
jgi:hypothetical protein